MRVVKILAAVPALAIVFVVVLLAYMGLDHFRETKLLAPSGPFAVGRTQYFWMESPASPSNAERKLLAWVWYPAAPPPAPVFDDYLPGPWRAALAQQTGFLFAQFLTRDLSRVRTHSIRDAEMSPSKKFYPVVLMRGGHSALSTDYTTLAEDLASHGYVVVGIDAPYRTMVVVLPDGTAIARSPENNAELGDGSQQARVANRLVAAWVSDMSFAFTEMERLNAADPTGRFQGKLDLQHAGAFGHSLGGAESLQFCHDAARCKAGIDIDGEPFGSVIAEGVAKPFLFLMSDHSGELAEETGPIESRLRSIFDRIPTGGGIRVTIRRASHFGFQDDVKSPILLGALRLLGKRLNQRRQLEITAGYVHTFFDVHLRGEPASKLELQREYPEVESVR